MIPTDEFFELPPTDQRHLVDEGHVVVNGEIAKTIPEGEGGGGVYVFDKPIIDQIVRHLKRGKYTANDLDPEFPVDKEILDEIIRSLRSDRIELLYDHFGVVRVADTEGAAYVYTVESIPFEARIQDPTLGGYLLLNNENFPLNDVPLSPGHGTRPRESYLADIEEYWGVPEDEAAANLQDEVGFAESTLEPLPIVDRLPNSESVVDRLLSVEESYARKRWGPRRAEHGIRFRKTRCRRAPSLPVFQEFALYLAELNRFATVESNPDVRDLVKKGGEIFYRCLYGVMWPGEPTGWVPFRVTGGRDELTKRQRRVVDLVELQPTKNDELVNRWGFEDGSALYYYLNGDFDRFAFRNSEQYICATESARRQVCTLIDRGTLTTTKMPPVVPPKRKAPIEMGDSDSDNQARPQRRNSREQTGSGTKWRRSS